MFSASNNNANHMTRINCLTSIFASNYGRIINSGATDHITSQKHLLQNIKELPKPHRVTIPDGNHILVTHSGSCILNQHITLTNVLLVSEI